MTERGLPYAWTAHPEYYRLRPYEAFIRNQYLKFVVQNPLYTAKLFLYYKPAAFFDYLTDTVGGIPLASWLLAACSLAFASLCFASGVSAIMVSELLLCSGIIWLSSLTPIFWADPGGGDGSDQIWSTLFTALLLIGSLGRAFARGASVGDEAARGEVAEPASA
jgi:hypothetical protein